MKCAIIVTYDPELQQLGRLTKCIEEAEFIPVIVDNSEKSHVEPEGVSKNSRILSMNGNQGIAAAQNRGIEYAFSIGAEIIGFFDQDSAADAGLIRTLSSFIEKNGDCVAAPVALEKDTFKEYPVQSLDKIGYPHDVFVKDRTEATRADIIISSGMMTTLKVLQKVGNYDEDFFIDFVDVEWCLRCKKMGIPIYVLPEAVLFHKIGNESIQMDGMEITVHSPVRTYYKVRNSFLMLYKKAGVIFSIRQILPAVIHNFLLLFKVQNKKDYFMYYLKGILHGICGVRGRYQGGRKNA